MNRRHLIPTTVALAVLAALGAGTAQAQDKFKIGLILPMTGPFASTGKQIDAAVKLYMAQNGDTVAGKKVEVIVKDDTSAPDVTKRIAQELVVNDKVNVLAGFGLTPLALATAPIATQSKTPMVVMAAATSSITEASPFIIRTSFTLPQAAVGMADWAPKNGIKKVVTLVSDYGPGIDAEKYFNDRFLFNGGQVVDKLRVPLRNPDFAPFLQKVRDAKPDALFVFVPSGAGAALMKQFAERGMDKAGIKLIGTGDVTDDDILNGMGDVALGVVTAHHYSASHNSPLNKKFVEAF
jgi:branched-chain amino acid transport system substrate-binding protein